MRVLKVDKAYHSHHMLPCSDPYIKSLQTCDIQLQIPSNTACSWFSSVSGNKITGTIDGLEDVYWTNNMTNTVLFSQSIKNAVAEEGDFDIAFEVGPHPALQGPALETIKAISSSGIPYSGLLRRGTNDVEAFSDTLGYAWKSFSIDTTLDLES